jgi:hypothetical protein
MAATPETGDRSAQTGTAPVRPSGSRGTSVRHRKRSRSRHRCQAKIRRYKYLVTGISIAFLLIYIFTWFHISAESTRHDQSILKLRKLEASLQGVTVELDRVRSERDELVQGRIPNLAPLVFDEAIAIDDNNIRNVIFTLVKNGNNSIYEYRLVLNNNGLSVIRPKIEIFLFNDLGIQIGNAQVESINATTDIDRMTLEPGEVRSYSDMIKMLRQGVPRYFLIHADHRERKEEKTRGYPGEIISP